MGTELMPRHSALSTRAPASLGVLSVHLDGERCRVGCEFCYLGARTDGGASAMDLELLVRAVDALSWDELAVAVSEPAEAAAPALARLFALAHRRERPLAITTTCQIAAAHPELLDGAARVNLSVDPRKGPVDPARLDALARRLHTRAPGLDVVLIVSLTTPEFAARLIDGGLLAELVELRAVDKVALNALKPPPPWCDRAFWLAALRRARAAFSPRARPPPVPRLLRRGAHPRPGRLPGARRSLAGAGGLAFRACVYQPAAEWIAADRRRRSPGACAILSRPRPARFRSDDQTSRPGSCTSSTSRRGSSSERSGCHGSAKKARRHACSATTSRASGADLRQRRAQLRLAGRGERAPPGRIPVGHRSARARARRWRVPAERDRAGCACGMSCFKSLCS